MSFSDDKLALNKTEYETQWLNTNDSQTVNQFNQWHYSELTSSYLSAKRREKRKAIEIFRYVV